MNALRLTSSRAAQSSRRFFASVDKPHVPDVYKYSVTKPKQPLTYNIHSFQAWFSDASTYPLLFCIGFAGFFCAGMFANEILTDKDLKLSPSIKHQILRDYGHEHTRSRAEAWASNTYHVNPEGLGVDHETWVKENSTKK